MVKLTLFTARKGDSPMINKYGGGAACPAATDEYSRRPRSVVAESEMDSLGRG
jgi:hypothetical protein